MFVIVQYSEAELVGCVSFDVQRLQRKSKQVNWEKHSLTLLF